MQFYITLGDNLDYLDGKHTIFGEVSEGFDILQKLNDVTVDEETNCPVHTAYCQCCSTVSSE